MKIEFLRLLKLEEPWLTWFGNDSAKQKQFLSETIHSVMSKYRNSHCFISDLNYSWSNIKRWVSSS